MSERYVVVSEQYGIRDDGLKQKLSDLEKKLNILLMLCMKYNLKKDSTLRFKIMKILRENLEEEKAVLQEFYHFISTI